MSNEPLTTVDIPVSQARTLAKAGLAAIPTAGNLRGKVTCRNGHIIGVSVREKTRSGGGTRSRLIVFRGALFAHMEVPTNIAFAKMDEGEVVCGICGDVKRWFKQKE